MVQACAEGAMDYTRADPLDNWFWRKNAWICDELLRKRNLEYWHASAAQKQAYLANARVSGEAARKIAEDADETHAKIYGGIFPWLANKDGATLGEKEVESLAAMWEKEFGDPDSPEVQKLVDAINFRPVMEDNPLF